MCVRGVRGLIAMDFGAFHLSWKSKFGAKNDIRFKLNVKYSSCKLQKQDTFIDIISIVSHYQLITAQYLIDCMWMYKDNTQ